MTESGKVHSNFTSIYVYYYNELSGDCQASIFTELWRLSVAFCVTLWHMSICSEVITNTSDVPFNLLYYSMPNREKAIGSRKDF